jgi:hypothetical protein
VTHRVAYNGSILLADDSRWTMDIIIERHEGDQGTFSAALFDTEPLEHCIHFSRQTLGHVPGCTAP